LSINTLKARIFEGEIRDGGGTNGHNKIKNTFDNLTRTKEKKAQVIDRKR
jgi:hypothetical protein